MKLKLKNFRCYEDQEFDFGFEGLVLLSGNSGRGKSTIMMAIMFVLYGEGTKIITFGKTNCQVEMEFDNLIIIRTKKPNRLVVKKEKYEFEDDAAQGIINQKFGIAFDVISYVQQNTFRSFIMMSPLEKLAFLEKFAFQGMDLVQLKGRCNSLIKKRNEELIGTTSQLEIITEHQKTLIRPERVLFPIKTNDKEKTIKNEDIRLKNCKTLIKRLEKTLQVLNEELTDTKIYSSQIIDKQQSIRSLTDKIRQIELDKGLISYEGDEKLLQYEYDLKIFLSQKELLILKECYDQDKIRLANMEENEITEINKEISFIKNNIWKEYNCEEINKIILEYQQLVYDAEKLERLKNSKNKYYVNEEKLKENKQTLERNKNSLVEHKELQAKLILQQESYKCPSCHVYLRFQNSKLYLIEEEIPQNEVSLDYIKNNILQLSKSISKLEYTIQEDESKLTRYNEIISEIKEVENQYEEEIPSKIEAESNLEYMKEYKRSQEELDKKRKKLEYNIKEKIFSNSIKLFKTQLLKQKEHISSIKIEKPVLKINEEELRHIIQTQKQNKNTISNYEKQLDLLTKELKIITQYLDTLKYNFKIKYEKDRDISIIETEILTKNKEIEELKIKAEIHENNIAKIEKYKKYKEELGRYTEWNKKIKDLTELEDKNRKKYAAATLLKDKILEAESIAILNVINSINIHAQEYLDIFFPDYPIVVRLLPFKITKKKTNKPQVNLEIDYKGMEADINMLSGGELARVVLAYTLALSEIFNSPMIMLDESTASLDQDMTSIVMDGIRKNFGNKLVVVIAHQVISGDFDRQISL